MSEDSAALQAPLSLPEAPPFSAPEPASAPSPEVFTTVAQAAGTAFDVTVDAPETKAPDAHAASPKPKRLRWLWWTAGSLAVASLAGLCAYLAVVANQWSDRVDDLTAISQDLGIQVSDQTAARKTAEAESAMLQSQVDTATARITDLANEEAKANDNQTVWVDLAGALIDCANGRQDLIDVLTNSRLYYKGKTNAQVENDLTTYCTSLTAEYTDITAEIGQ